jgi:tetratricopeptide (TPR) repeat protein
LDYNSAFDALWICDDFLTLRGYYTDQVELYGQLVSKWKEIGDRENWNYKASLTSLGNAYYSLGHYQRAIEFHQQSLDIAREIGDLFGEAIAWFNLGLALENLNRKSDALGAYHNARELFQRMELDANVQNCNNAIERVSQPKTPVVSRRGFWGWLRRLWRSVRAWFRR